MDPWAVVFASHLWLAVVWPRMVLGKVGDNENSTLSAPFYR